MTRKRIGIAMAICGVVAALWLALGRNDTGPRRGPVVGGQTLKTPNLRPERPDLPTQIVGPGGLAQEGRVVDRDGQAIEGVAISAQLETAGVQGPAAPGFDTNPSVVATAGPGGEFVLRGLERGRYRVRIEGPGVVTAEVRLVEVPGPSLRMVAARLVSIDGRVVGASGATLVTIARRSGDVVDQVLADPGGSFRFKELPEGSYVVAARGDRHATRSLRVESTGVGHVVLLLEPALSASGRVVDDGGNGIAATVTVTADGMPERRVVSESDGTFSVEALLPGRVAVAANSPDFVPAETVSFSIGRGFSPVIRLARAGILRGIVFDAGNRRLVASARIELVMEAGQAIGGKAAGRFIARGELGVVVGPIPFPPVASPTRVRIADPVDRDQPDDATTESDGKGAFAFTGLSPGRFQMRVTHPDYAPWIGPPTAVSSGATREVEVTLARGTIVRGTVRADGRGVGFASVTLRDASNQVVGPIAVTDDSGSFSLPRATGNVTVEVLAGGYAPARRRLLLGQEKPGPEMLIDVELVAASQKLMGKVVDPRGQPVPGAVLELQGVGQMAIAGPGGEFSLFGLAPGKHKVRVTATGYPPIETSLDASGANIVKIRFGGGASLRVRRAANREPVVAATVTAKGPRGAKHSLVTDSFGEIELRGVSAGSWKFEVRAPGLVSWTGEVAVPVGRSAHAVTQQNVLVEMHRGASVAGEVRDHNGEIVRNAEVRIGGVATRSDEFGRFRLSNVATGAVELTAVKGGSTGVTALRLAPGDELVTTRINLRPKRVEAAPPADKEEVPEETDEED